MITAADSEKLHQLVQLKMPPAHQDALLAQLNGIVAVLDELQRADTQGVAPLLHIHEAIREHSNMPLRHDECPPQLERTALQSNAQNVCDGLFTTPRVL